MISAIFLIACLVFLSEFADACNKRRPPPPPPPPPPPGTPPPPPPPPPIMKVVRQKEQVMSRNNCKAVQVTTQNQQSLESSTYMSEQVQEAMMALKNEGINDKCLNYEQFEYECTFDVFSEIALTVIYHPTGCGCAFTIQVVEPRPRADDVSSLVSVNAAYSTEVTRFSIVVYDFVADKVEEEIEAFKDMVLDPAVKDTIEAQVAADPNGDFQSITAGFAGVVKSFPKLPETLNKNDPANSNYIPAIRFSIAQKYKSGAMFKVPCDLKMHTAPNAYQSQCQPFRPEDFNAAAKRMVDNVNDKAWVRTFYLFPKQSASCGTSGYTPKSRYIVSLYNDNVCSPSSGYFSIDTEFESTFTASEALVGAWKWERSFEEQRAVFGVPSGFSSLTSVWCLGYSQITWDSPSSFEPTQVPVNKGVCGSLPSAASWNGAVQDHKYGENHKSFPVTDGGFNCQPLQLTCKSDVTLLAFQNDDPRDFLKHKTSTLVTGPRTRFCSSFSQDGASIVEFDTMVYGGVEAGDALERKRSTPADEQVNYAKLHMVYDSERRSLRHSRHAPELVRAYNMDARKRAAEPMARDPAAAVPERDNFAITSAAGSVDVQGENGASAGDHPLRQFPETYSAPLTLDPSRQMTEPLVYGGELVNGVPPKYCELGDLGCTCRDDSSCDFPYECNSVGFCQRRACEAGKPGCPVHSDGTCDAKGVDDAPLVAQDGACVYAQPSVCASQKALGCACDTTCDGGAECVDGFCVRPAAQQATCAPGEPGCPCGAQGQCASDAACDKYSFLCVYQACTHGTPGCEKQLEGTPCAPGFVPNEHGNCVAASCIAGEPGCACASQRSCNRKGFVCVDLDRNGAQTLCVGDDPCKGGAEQEAACASECGAASNVYVCPKCSYSRPICKNERLQFCNPKSYLYGIEKCEYDTSAAAAPVAALVAAFVALVAALV